MLTPVARHRRRRLRRRPRRRHRRSAPTVVAIPPDRHDALVAVVSHVPHLTAATLMRLADERSEEHRAAAAPGRRRLPRHDPHRGRPSRHLARHLRREPRRHRRRARPAHRARWARCATSWPTATATRCSTCSSRPGAARIAPAGPRQPGPRTWSSSGSPIPDRTGVLAAVITLATELDVSIADIEIAHSIEGDEGVLILAGRRRRWASGSQGGLDGARLPARRCARSNERRSAERPDPLPIEPLSPARSTPSVACPGSKSITNRALVCAALADGHQHARRRAVRRRHRGDARAASTQLGVGDRRRPGGRDRRRSSAPADGCRPGPVVARRPPVGHDGAVPAARCSALGPGPYVLDGGQPLRARPMGDGLDALRALGATVDELGEPGHLPVAIRRGAGRPAAARGVPRRRVEPVPLGPAAGRAVLPDGLAHRRRRRRSCRGPTSTMTSAVMARVRRRGRRRPDERTLRRRARPATGPTDYRDRARRVGRRRTSSPPRRSPAAGCASTGSGAGSLQGDLALRRRARADGRRGRAGRRDVIEVRGTGALHGVDGRPGRPLRHRPDAGRGRRVRRRADRRSPASGSSGARRPTASPRWSPSCGAAASRPTEDRRRLHASSPGRRSRR